MKIAEVTTSYEIGWRVKVTKQTEGGLFSPPHTYIHVYILVPDSGARTYLLTRIIYEQTTLAHTYRYVVALNFCTIRYGLVLILGFVPIFPICLLLLVLLVLCYVPYHRQ